MVKSEPITYPINHYNCLSFAIKIFEGASNLTNNHPKSCVELFIQSLKGLLIRKNPLNSLVEDCCLLFDRIEKIPVIFSGPNDCLTAQNELNRTCLKCAGLIIDLLLDKKSKNTLPLEQIIRRVVALQYRLEKTNHGNDRSVSDLSVAAQLKSSALAWKKNHPLIIRKDLTSTEIEKLNEVSTYSSFANLMLATDHLQEDLFNWVLRDGNEISPFVQFPATCERLKSADLAFRLGRFSGTMFPIKKRKTEIGLEKQLCLPFFINNKIKYVNILDETKEVELEGWRLTIGKVIDIFFEKKYRVGDLEFFGTQGITNWNCHKQGVWDPQKSVYKQVDFTKQEWWKQLPILEEITAENLELRLGEKLQNNEWVACAKSSRVTTEMDLADRHGYIEIAIPAKNGLYHLYPFGNFPETFPNTIVDLLLFMVNTLRAKISYPDENFFYSQRQQATFSIKMDEENGRTLMKEIQKDLIKANFGHLVFQFGAENCAHWAQKRLHVIDNELHNFYKLDFLSCYPQNPVLGRLFDFCRSLPFYLQSYAIKTGDILLGSFRGISVFENRKRVYKSHQTSAIRNECTIYQPGYLHQQIEQQKLKGFIKLGNC